LAEELSAAFQVNAYLSPPGAQGFDTHVDTHDVFVLQVAGTKQWTVYGPTVELPLRTSRFRPAAGTGSPLFVPELRPGDAMYIPRGFPHHAASLDATSLHLTVGAHTMTWAALVQAAVEACCGARRRFGRSLPPGFARSEEARRRRCSPNSCTSSPAASMPVP
jgi:ribosomal protein L16 Arg81 hydroxylase